MQHRFITCFKNLSPHRKSIYDWRMKLKNTGCLFKSKGFGRILLEEGRVKQVRTSSYAVQTGKRAW